MLKPNKYDYGIILLISLLVFGGIGGAFQPVRIFGLLFSPIVYFRLLTGKTTNQQKWIFGFFVLWICYSILSLLWTPDIGQGLKELVYFYTHFSLFFLLVFWSQKASNPLKALTSGWTLILVLTIPIAFYEITTFQHLPISRFGSDRVINLGGTIIRQRFASVTFLNSNTYVVMVIFCLPFLLSKITTAKKMGKQIFLWALVLACSAILVINASRGGVICLVIILMTFLLMTYRRSILKPKNLFVGVLVLIGVLFILFNFTDVIFRIFLFRTTEAGALLEDSNRIYLYGLSLTLLMNSLFLGTGIGSEVAAMSTLSRGITTVHNLFLEVLMQYGLLVFGLFCVFLVKIFYRLKFLDYKPAKFILIAFLLAFIPLFIINSGYLLQPSVWLLFSSLFIIGSNKKIVGLSQKHFFRG